MGIVIYTIGGIIIPLSIIVGSFLLYDTVSTILQSRKRDLTEDEQEFLDWMKCIPDLKKRPNDGEIRRWHIEIGNQTNRIYVEDDKYRNYIIIDPSGEILGCDSGPIDEDHESLGMRFTVYDFRSTKELSKFKQIYIEIAKKVRYLQLRDEKIREYIEKNRHVGKGLDIIQKMRTG